LRGRRAISAVGPTINEWAVVKAPRVVDLTLERGVDARDLKMSSTCVFEGPVVTATDAVHSLPLKGGGLGRGSLLLRESLQQRKSRRDLTPTRRLRRIRVFPNSAILKILPKSETSDFGWPTSPFQGEVKKKLAPPLSLPPHWCRCTDVAAMP
jgi:hypothetical protein